MDNERVTVWSYIGLTIMAVTVIGMAFCLAWMFM